MELELQRRIFPQFRVEIPPLMKSNNTHFSTLRIPSSFGESFPTNLSRSKSLEVHCNNGQSVQQAAASASDNLRLPELSFNRLQPTDRDCDGLLKRQFGRYLAREAFLDEEYWTAAWLRAEAHWESVSYMRHIDVHKRKYAEQVWGVELLGAAEVYLYKMLSIGMGESASIDYENNRMYYEAFLNNGFSLYFHRVLYAFDMRCQAEEFYALKRRCSGLDGNSLRCFCLVAVKREDKNARRTVLNSIVGTLDLSIRQFLQGETYPGEKKSSVVLACQEPFGMHRYAYIANVCVSKFARRQRIASNMLHLAMDVAAFSGMKQLFVHVNADNNAAQDLYSKTGFKIVEVASSISEEQRLLMSKEL